MPASLHYVIISQKHTIYCLNKKFSFVKCQNLIGGATHHWMHLFIADMILPALGFTSTIFKKVRESFYVLLFL